MELKQNICVYIEIAGGALSPLSIELLGKARRLRRRCRYGQSQPGSHFLWR